jgi:hypothetical protein
MDQPVFMPDRSCGPARMKTDPTQANSLPGAVLKRGDGITRMPKNFPEAVAVIPVRRIRSLERLLVIRMASKKTEGHVLLILYQSIDFN